ncbi:hypothetical protein ACQEVB_02295 [Pseudonocardia sp. CA-107938]|uniref:hypothetical protein n=1 Tax=Pseudonocardia sp. CA-107938 TaxID=3240021 RepID=UPI003D8C009B
MRTLVVGLAVLLLAGCSSAVDAAPVHLPRYGSLSELVNGVAERQRTEQSARISLRGEITGGQSTLQFTGEGVLRGSGNDVSVKFTQVVTQRGADPQETGFVVLPDALYLLQPGRQKAAKPWTKVDRTSTDPDDQRLLALSSTLVDSADPARTLSRYADATSISDTADDVIEGDPAVRYTIVVDLAKAAATQPDAEARKQLQQQVAAGLTTLTSNLWVDRDSRPVRTVVRQDLPGIGTLSIMGSYRDWGRPVDIEAPPKAQVR